MKNGEALKTRHQLYYLLHKETLKNKAQIYRNTHREEISIKDKKRYNKNRERILRQKKDYLSSNREEINNRRRKDSWKYRKRVAEYNKKYSKEHKIELNKYAREYYRKRIKIDLQYKMSISLRTRLKNILKNSGIQKGYRTMKYVGCSKEELKKHIENLFVDGMSWENYGKWHIDHFYPLSKIDLTQEKNIYIAMNFKNLRPMWAIDNIKKGNKII